MDARETGIFAKKIPSLALGSICDREDCGCCGNNRDSFASRGAYFANPALHHANVILFDKGCGKEQFHQSR
jgi:hypothetical protein